MATLNISPMRIKSGGGEVVYLPEAASQTYKKGQLIYVDTSGDVTVCGDNAQLVFGIATMDGQNNASAGAVYTYVQKILPGTVLIANVYHGTAASALAPESLVGDGGEIASTSNKTVFDISSDSVEALLCVARVQDDAVSDVYGRVECVVMSSFLQGSLLQAS